MEFLPFQIRSLSWSQLLNRPRMNSYLEYESTGSYYFYLPFGSVILAAKMYPNDIIATVMIGRNVHTIQKQFLIWVPEGKCVPQEFTGLITTGQIKFLSYHKEYFGADTSVDGVLLYSKGEEK